MPIPPNEMEPQGETVQEQQNPAMESQEPQQEPGAPRGGFSSDEVKAQIKVPPEMRKAYDRIVLAGMKVMFSQQTHQMAMKSLEGDGPIEQRLAKGVSDLMLVLWKQSNGTMPPQLVFPAAIELMLEAIDFLNESGAEQVSEQQIGESIRQLIGTLMEKFKINEASVKQGMTQQEQGAAVAGAEPPQEGIVGKAMGAG